VRSRTAAAHASLASPRVLGLPRGAGVAHDAQRAMAAPHAHGRIFLAHLLFMAHPKCIQS
jgi:hypothetical protein